MKISNLKKLYIYICLIIPFLVSLCFFFYSINNKKFEIEYTLEINDEVKFIDNMLRKYADLSIFNSFSSYIKKNKYNKKIGNIKRLRKEKNLILKEWRTIGQDTPFSLITFAIYGKNYDKSLIDKYVQDVIDISLETSKKKLKFNKNLLISENLDIAKILKSYHEKVLKLPSETYVKSELDGESIILIQKFENIVNSPEKYVVRIQSETLIIKSNTHFLILSVILYFITALIILFIIKLYSFLDKNILTIKKKTIKLKSKIF